jgi:cardiolipin synthase A/B
MIFDIFTLVLLCLNIFFAIVIIFVQRKNPTAIAAWLLVLFLIPLLGFLLFLVFGQNYRKEKMFRMKIDADQQLTDIISTQKELVKSIKIDEKDQWSGDLHRMILMLLENNGAAVTRNNDIKVYTDGKLKFADLLEAIGKARDHVHMEYFILKDDGIGRDIMTALTERSRAGTEVRLLVDGVGSGGLPRHFFEAFEKAGGKHAIFFPSLIPFFNFRINYRNHRKIAVIDGETAFVGGYNIGDDYLGLDKHWGYWRDAAIRIEGHGAMAAQLRFLLDWNYASNDHVDVNKRYFPDTPHPDASILQVVSGGPDARWNPIKESYLKMINSATRTVYIQSPYFIPDESVTDALRIAALSGIDVRVMIPSRPDHMFVYWASHSYVEDLLDSGVKAYTYDNGFLHAKTIVIDGKVVSVGSANWDVRSFRLNFETNAIVYDEKVAVQFHKAYLDDLAFCTELTLEYYRTRSTFFKARSSFSRLFSPIL